MKEYKVTMRKGIDDLLSHSPYENAHDWPIFRPFYKITEDEYLSSPKDYEDKVQAQNDQYVKELKEKGTYGHKHTTKILFNEHPEFENKSNNTTFSNWGIAMPLGLGKDVQIPKMTLDDLGLGHMRGKTLNKEYDERSKTR